MHLLFISSLSLILFFCFISFYLMKRSRVSIYFFFINTSIFFYILSVYSLLFGPQLHYFRILFACGAICVLFIYFLLKEMTHTSVRIMDRIYFISSIIFALLALSTPWVVVSYTQQPLMFSDIHDPILVLQSFKLNYGWLYKANLFLVFYPLLRGAYLIFSFYRTSKYKTPIIYSWGSVCLFIGLSILSNVVYPAIFQSSKYSFLVIFWSLILCLGNFIAIVKYEYLNIKLVFSKSLLFFLIWASLFSTLFCFGMYGMVRSFNIESGVGIFCILLYFLLIYQSFRDTLIKRFKNFMHAINKDFQEITLELSKELLHAKSLSHVFFAMQKLFQFLEADQWFGMLKSIHGQAVYKDNSIPKETYFQLEHDIAHMDSAIQIKVKNNFVFLTLKLERDGQYYGWFHFRMPIYKHFWISSQKKELNSVISFCINSIQLIFSYDNINHKIKHLSNANEFVSRLSLTSVNTISTMILNQLKQTFGFDHVILPKFSHYGMEWSSSTVYVPEDIRSLIYSLDVPSMFKFPYDPIELKINDFQPESPFIQICHYYESDECYLLPIVQDDLLVGYYMGFSKQKNILVDKHLLSIINKQISSILYRSIVNNKIASTKHFYQEIIDYLSSIIVVLDQNFDIQFSNKYFKSFFNKNYYSFKELIYDYPNLDIINKIIDFSDTELTIQIKKQHFKVSLRHLMDDNIIVLLTNVTDLVKIQHTISKSSKLKGMGTFVAGVAHEIKNPLVAVKTFTQLISKDWNNTDIRQKCKQIVLPQLHRIDNLSQSLNYFGKAEKTNFKPTNLSQLLYDTEELLRADESIEKAIDIVHNIEPNVMVFANSITLGQVFLNLSLNAIDAVKDVQTPQIHFHLFTDSITKVIIDIEDNGSGIAAQDIQHLFDPFFTTKDSGTGLGLSIVHQIVSDHQGSISIHKTDDQGTIFRLILPKLLRPKKSMEFTDDR